VAHEVGRPTPSELETILELNAESLWALSPLDRPGLDALLDLAGIALVTRVDGGVTGFALALWPAQAYPSANYRWFSERYPSFLYLDRIAVRAGARRSGAGRALYDAMESAARPAGRMLCEVNVEPPNDASRAFHAARGYLEVGRLAHPGGKVVAMLAKELADPAG
jgi:predicted GNAT superfamily acetyltransferase